MKRYMKSGWFFLDCSATFPFYLFKTSNGSWLKLLRMSRIPKILNLVEEKRFDQIVENIVSGLTLDKQIMYKIVIK